MTISSNIMPVENTWTRKPTLGGSDAAASLGLSEWKTSYELWLEMRGEAAPTPDNWPMRQGRIMEPEIRRFHEEQAGESITQVKDSLVSEKHPFMHYSPDGMIPSRKLLAEYKTARWAKDWGEPESGDVPESYLVQCMHGLIVTGYDVCELYASIGGAEPVRYIIEPDTEMMEMIVAGEADFVRMVKDGTPPDPVTEDDVRRRWKKSVGKEVEATSDVVSRLRLMKEYKEQAKVSESVANDWRIEILNFMKENDTLTYQGKTLATWKQATASMKFDTENFRTEQPEMYRRYLRQVDGSRRFLLKGDNNANS